MPRQRTAQRTPSFLALALLLQTHDRVSDAEATARAAFLTEVIQEGHRVLALTRQLRCQLEEGSEADQRIATAAELLTQLLWQDVDP